MICSKIIIRSDVSPRKGSEQKISHYKDPVLVKTGIDIVNGDITDAASLDGKLEGCDAVINLVGIIREFRGRGLPLRSCTTRGRQILSRLHGHRR